MTNKKQTHYIIIGGGIAGVSAAEAIREVDDTGKITLICSESELPYFRMNLTRYLAGEIDESKLPLHTEAWYKTHQIELLLENKVEVIEPKKKKLILSDKSDLSYDQLIIANGAQPFVPPFPGKDLKGVMTVRSHTDADQILDCCASPIKVICIGGGLLGLENAGALAKRGVDVTVIETFDWLLPRQLPKEGGKKLEESIKKMGIKVVTGGKVKEIRGETTVKAVAFEDGSELPADLVLITTGVAADLNLAKAANLKVNKGVVVDEQMRSSEADIYAAGDICECNGKLYGLWLPAKAQGTVAGHNAAGKKDVFKEMPPSAKLKVLGIDLFSVGQVAPADEKDLLLTETKRDCFAGFVLREGVIVGASLLGDLGLMEEVKMAVNDKRPVADANKKISVAFIKEKLKA
ncbi:MAG: FAD-dependent oxidoreductase [Anaerolineaceae bacterium]|nr:FAD-dependent oxidoreductase [Anaerolineaceae bacterium]